MLIFRKGIETWIYIVVSLLLGAWLPWIDRNIFPGWFSPVDRSTIISILAAVASGMITLSGLVFSLVFVLVQFGSSTYSPRLTRVFAHSYVLNHSLGIFTGTFLYCLMAMRAIGIAQTKTSGLAVWIAFLWLLLSIYILARLIRVFTTMTVSNILRVLSTIGKSSIGQIYPSYTKHNKTIESVTFNLQDYKHSSQPIIYRGSPGYIVEFRIQKLLKTALETNAIIYLPYFTGDLVESGSVLALILGGKEDVGKSSILNSIQIESERGFRKDPKYTIRLLVDTAIRGLSPAVNDPTTAVQVLDHLESLLFQIGNSKLDIGEIHDKNGMLRVVFKTPDWQDYLQLGVTEIMQYGATSIQVQRRLKALLHFLKDSIPSDRKDTVDNYINLQEQLVQQSFDNTTFRKLAGISDREGIGSS